MPVLLEVKNLNKSFGGVHAVNNVSFTLNSGIIKAIIGPNGAGKTTLFNIISGILKANSGRVSFKGEDITGLNPHEIAERGIVRTFQNIKLAGHMSVLDNVMIGRHSKTRAGFFAAALSLPWTIKEEARTKEVCMEIMEMFSLTDLANEEVSNLPFGKQRAVEFARALAADPELLLLDEPASGLNIYETEELAEVIERIKNKGITILLVEHDMSLVMDISDEILVLNFGKEVASGLPEKVQKNPEVINIYLGEG